MRKPRPPADFLGVVRNNSSSRRGHWIWPVVLAALIGVASHRPQLVDTGISGGDKVVHFLVYGLLGTLVCRLGTGWRMAVLALLATSAFGVLDEWHQSFVPGREMDAADWVADTLGAGLAIALYTGWAAYRRLLETPLPRRPTRVSDFPHVAR